MLALGQETDSGFLRNVPGRGGCSRTARWSSDRDMMTGHPGMFAGGDMVPSERTVTVAVGHGKLAARNIDAWLRGGAYRRAGNCRRWSTSTCCICRCSATSMPSPQRELRGSQRLSGFDEVVAGLSEAEARHEAQRCLSCGNCFECDNCYAACPEDAIVKLGPGKRLRYDYATVYRLRGVLRAMPLPRDRDGRPNQRVSQHQATLR